MPPAERPPIARGYEELYFLTISSSHTAMRSRQVLGLLASCPAQCNSPKTATLLVVPTNTLPSATTGVMNLLPIPK